MLSSSAAGRIVILLHDHPFRHWDLLLEKSEAADTWRLLRPPLTGEPIAATQVADHRLHYLTWEGAVSGNRGTVQRLHSGTYQQVNCAGLPTWMDSAGRPWQLPQHSTGLRLLQIRGIPGVVEACLIATSDQREFWYFR